MECEKNRQIINYIENKTKSYIYHYYLKKIISNLSYLMIVIKIRISQEYFLIHI